MKRSLPLALAVSALAGCASYDGRTLIPGKSTTAELEATMGIPAERQARAGETIWWYPRGPMGFHSYAVRVGPDGIVRDIEQRLTVENVRKIAAGKSTKQDVHDLFGPPFLTAYMARQQREVWEYQILEVDFKWKLWVQFSDDGIVREVLQMRHPDMDPPGVAGKD
jgi:hypothetical protein